MLALQGFGGGGGLGAYGSAAFSCSNGICVGSYTDVSTVFRRVQALTNQAAKMLGIGAPITVDGKIGAGTVARLVLVSTSMPPRPDLPLLTSTSGLTTTSLAANAEAYAAELEALISGEIQMPVEMVPGQSTLPIVHNIPTTPTRPVSTPGVPGAGPHITETATAAIGQIPMAARVVFGLAAVGIIGAVIYKRRKKPANAAPGVAGLFGYRRPRRRR